MRITRTLAGGLCAAVTAALLTLGSAAAAPQSFLDDVTVGEVLTAASRLHAAYTGEGEAKDIFAKNGDYSSVLRYAESSGILSAADSYDCAEKATRVDLAKLLYTALPESQYSEINGNYRRISDMSVLSDGYEEVLALCRAGVFSSVDEEGNFEPNGTVTAAQLNEIVARVSFADRRVTTENTVAAEPKQAFNLAITSSMDSYKEGIQSGWEMDNRAGNPRTSLGANAAVVDVMTDEKSRVIRHFNRMTEDVIEVRIQLSFALSFDGSVLELCDEDDTPTYRLVCSGGDSAFRMQTAA